MYKLAEKVGFLMFIMAVSYGAPVKSCSKKPWELPCGIPITGNVSKDIPETVQRLERIVRFIERAKNDSRDLKRLLITRLEMPNCSADTISTSLEGFPNINSTWAQIREIPFDVPSNMMDDHVALSTAYIYLEQTKKDEIDNDNEASLVEQLSHLEGRLLSIMCYFERNINQTISYPSRSVMPESYWNQENSAKRNIRDVVLLRETHLLLTAMFKKYDGIMQMHRILDVHQTALDAFTRENPTSC